MRNHTTTHTQNSIPMPLSHTDCDGGSAMPGVARRGQGSADGTTPHSNTGVQIPSLRSGGFIDWLSATISVMDIADRDYIVQNLVRFFGGAQPAKVNLRHYTNTLDILDGGKIAWNKDRLDMGVYVSLPAKSLSLYCERLGRETGVYKIIIHFFGFDPHFTRCDIALDTDLFTVQDIDDAIGRGELVTYFRKKQRIQGIDGDSGHTINFGSRSGEGRYCRLYNKADEQGVEGVWTRLEIEHKGSAAHAVVCALMRSTISYEEIVASAFDFRNTDNDRTNRRTRAQWWADFLGDIQELFKLPSRTKSTIEGTKEWLEKAVMPSLALLVKVEGGDFSWLHEAILAAVGRIPSEKLVALGVLQSEGGAA